MIDKSHIVKQVDLLHYIHSCIQKSASYKRGVDEHKYSLYQMLEDTHKQINNLRLLGEQLNAENFAYMLGSLAVKKDEQERAIEDYDRTLNSEKALKSMQSFDIFISACGAIQAKVSSRQLGLHYSIPILHQRFASFVNSEDVPQTAAMDRRKFSHVSVEYHEGEDIIYHINYYQEEVTC